MSEQNFRALFENAATGIGRSRITDGKLLMANRKLARMFGYQRADQFVAEFSFIDRYVDPGQRERVIALYKEGIDHTVKVSFTTRDGSVITVENQGWLDEKAGHIDFVMTDITERIRAEESLRKAHDELETRVEERTSELIQEIQQRIEAEEALRNSEDLLTSIFENVPVGLLIKDADHLFERANSTYLNWYGFDADIMVGRLSEEVEEFQSAEEVELMNAQEREVLTKGLTQNRQVERHFADHQVHNVSITKFPVYDQQGNITKVGSVSVDLTEQVQTRKALAYNEARFKDFAESASDWFWEMDEKLRFSYFSDRFTEISGVANADLIGKTRQQSGLDMEDERVCRNIEDLKARRPFKNFEHSRTHPDGSVVHMSTSGTPVFDEDGAFKGYRGTGADISESKQVEKELTAHRDHLQELVDTATQELKAKATELELALAKEQELTKLQREFVSMASHEFRTPLAIIDATAQRMKRRADKNQLTPEDAAQRVEKIREAVVRMTRLMESTLDAASMEEGVIKVEIEPCDICKVVREVCSRQQEIAQTHIISCDLADLPVTIQADTGSLEQVLNNLLSNAVKYAPDAPDIEVKAHTEDDQVVISVHDHGIGIDEDELGRIGERFFRARTSTGTAGTGIGLNLAKTLVEMHGGTVSVESQKGEGSTFTIRLPIAGPDQSEKVDTKVA